MPSPEAWAIRGEILELWRQLEEARLPEEIQILTARIKALSDRHRVLQGETASDPLPERHHGPDPPRRS